MCNLLCLSLILVPSSIHSVERQVYFFGHPSIKYTKMKTMSFSFTPFLTQVSSEEFRGFNKRKIEGING